MKNSSTMKRILAIALSMALILSLSMFSTAVDSPVWTLEDYRNDVTFDVAGAGVPNYPDIPVRVQYGAHVLYNIRFNDADYNVTTVGDAALVMAQPLWIPRNPPNPADIHSWNNAGFEGIQWSSSDESVFVLEPTDDEHSPAVMWAIGVGVGTAYVQVTLPNGIMIQQAFHVIAGDNDLYEDNYNDYEPPYDEPVPPAEDENESGNDDYDLPPEDENESDNDDYDLSPEDEDSTSGGFWPDFTEALVEPPETISPMCTPASDLVVITGSGTSCH